MADETLVIAVFVGVLIQLVILFTFFSMAATLSKIEAHLSHLPLGTPVDPRER